MSCWEVVFWVSAVLVTYPYVIYPALLVAINKLGARDRVVAETPSQPTISIILPVANEARRIEAKLRNIFALNYPQARMQVIVVGDGCTDDTLERARALSVDANHVVVTALPQRSGKAAALNAGLALATGEIIVFTDAAIMLDADSLTALLKHFDNPAIGCVSGEDYVEGGGSEGLYGRLELLLRREEAKLHSIAGASGCYYAQRKSLCRPFIGGMAPDFLSVLNTVAAGSRAVCEPQARGAMTATSSQSAEFSRKTRTFLRGITALFGNAALLNPFEYPAFSFILFSHKLMRWLAPIPMFLCLLSAWLMREHSFYLAMLIAQAAFYGLAIVGILWPKASDSNFIVRLSAFFVLVNIAAFKALLLWLIGRRVEIWEPTRRPV
jgi:glycosyltransferase involved in cell wall biosynthesis